MTIRETAIKQKKNHTIYSNKYYFFLTIVLLVAGILSTTNLCAQQPKNPIEEIITDNNFETTKEQVDKVASEKNNLENSKLLKNSSNTIENSKESDKKQPQDIVEKTPQTTDKIISNVTKLKAQLTQQTKITKQLKQQLEGLRNQYSELNNALQSFKMQQQASATLKTKITRLAIQAAALKTTKKENTSKAQVPNKDSKWYEKLVVVKKIEPQNKLDKSAAKTKNLRVILQHFDLIKLAIDLRSQSQWQDEIKKTILYLQNNYADSATNIVQQLTTLQALNISLEFPQNAASIESQPDSKYGIR